MQIEYKKNEFCESIGCEAFKSKCRYKNKCIKTAKDFHNWLKANQFKIVKTKCSKCNGDGYYYMTVDSWASAYPEAPKPEKFICDCDNGEKNDKN